MFDFYGPQYARFDSELAAELRREVYGEDIGQQGWRTAAEQAEIADLLRAGPDSHVLDVACGAGGPSLALVERTGCRLTGLDAEAAGIAHAEALASARALADGATFAVLDCGGRLPFDDGTFDAVLCVDAICHLPDRFATLSEWARVLRPGGRLLFSDPAVVTGAVAKSALDVRAATGFSSSRSDSTRGLSRPRPHPAALRGPHRRHGGDCRPLARRSTPARRRPPARGGRRQVRAAATLPRDHGRAGREPAAVTPVLRRREGSPTAGGS
jgi:SAM-dependent methyltransferase